MFETKLVPMIRRNARAFIAAGTLALLSTGIPFVYQFIADGASISSYPWKSTLACAFALALLFVFLAEKHLIHREKTLFSSLKVNKNLRVVALEIFFQLLLAAVIFLFLFMLGKEQLDFFRAFFYVVVSLVGALAVTHLDMPNALQRLLPWIAYAVLVTYSYYVLIIYGYTSWTQQASDIAAWANRIIPWVRTVGVLLVVAEFKLNRPRALMICLTGFVLFFAFQATGFPLLSEFCGLVLLSNFLSSPRTTAKVAFGTILFYIVFLCVGLAVGWVNNLTLSFEYAASVPTFGMSHPNLIALVLFTVFILIWYLWLADRYLLTLLIFWISAGGIWYLTRCRTILLVMGVFPLLYLIVRYLLKKGNTKVFRLLICFPVFFAMLSVVCMYWLPTQLLFSTNGNFFLRFSYPWRVVSQYGLSLFGGAPQVDIIDNVFLHILVYYGIVPFVLITGLLTWVTYRYWKNQQFNELLLLAIFIVYSFMENAMIHMPFGFSALLVMNEKSKSV